MVGATMGNTANPTMLGAGYKHNVIPGRATASIDGRFVPGGQDAFFETITELLGDKVRYEIENVQPAVETEFSGALVEAMQGCLVAEDPARQGGAVPDERRHRRQVPGTRSGCAASASPRCGSRPTSTSWACSTAWTSGCPTESLEFGARVLDRFLDQA